MSANEPNDRPEEMAPATPDPELRWSPEPEIESPLTAESSQAAVVPPPPPYYPPPYYPPAYSQPAPQTWPQAAPAPQPAQPAAVGHAFAVGRPGSRLPRPSRATRAGAGSSR